MKKYHSLLDRIPDHDSGFFNPFHETDEKSELTKFSGSIFQALASTRKLFERIFLGNDLIESTEIVELLLMNSRIIRGILDYKNCPAGVLHQLYRVIPSWVDMSLGLYQGDESTLVKLEELEQNLKDIGSFEMLQRFDSETWEASNPFYCKKSTEMLVQEIGTEKFVFIALGHGGILPGVDVYLRLTAELSQESQFYPIRFSRAKKKDKAPRVDYVGEFPYLAEVFDGKLLVLFDEDASSGNTLLKAESYFYENFPSLKRILKVSNIGKFAPK